MIRQQDVIDARAAADQWASERGLPSSGGYSGQWYEDGYLGGWWPYGWLKWWAAYGIAPGSILGGDIVAHQFTSTPIDTDELLDSEIVDYGGNGNVDDQERKQYQDKIDGLVNSLGYLVGDALKPLTRSTAAKYVKTYVDIARGVADQQGISHA